MQDNSSNDKLLRKREVNLEKKKRGTFAQMNRTYRRLCAEAYVKGGMRSLDGAAHIWLGLRAWMNTGPDNVPHEAWGIAAVAWGNAILAPVTKFSDIATKLQMLEHYLVLEECDDITRIVSFLGAIRASIPDDMAAANRQEAERLLAAALAREARPAGGTDHA